MKSLFNLEVILIGLAIFGNSGICRAQCSECAWVLWKMTTINNEIGSRSWEIVTAVPTYRQCFEGKSNLVINELEVYRKISKSADETSKDHILAIMRDTKNQKDVIHILDYYCFHDTIDPRK